MTSQCLPLLKEKQQQAEKLSTIILIANINGKSPLLIFVIARISVQNINPHLTVGRSGLGDKVKCNKIPHLRKDQN